MCERRPKKSSDACVVAAAAAHPPHNVIIHNNRRVTDLTDQLLATPARTALVNGLMHDRKARLIEIRWAPPPHPHPT